MQYIHPCEFCGGAIKAQQNEWECQQCGARWTLGMRLIAEGQALRQTLDDLFGEEPPTERPTSMLADTVMHYIPTPTGRKAKCRVRHYRYQGVDVLIATELDDNPGMSITNAAEDVFRTAATMFGVNLDKAICIEHYAKPIDTFDLVQLDDSGAPHWQRIAVEEVERLTGDFFDSLTTVAVSDSIST